MNKNEIGGTCGTCGRQKRGAYRVLVENLWKREDLEKVGVDGRVNMQDVGGRGMEGIDLTQARVR
jgi:hypothetical protein